MVGLRYQLLCEHQVVDMQSCVTYKRLLKFERATEKVLELKREILESFQGRSRVKRLSNAGDERREQSRTAGIQKVLCCKQKIELLDRVKANFERS